MLVQQHPEVKQVTEQFAYLNSEGRTDSAPSQSVIFNTCIILYIDLQFAEERPLRGQSPADRVTHAYIEMGFTTNGSRQKIHRKSGLDN